MSNKTVTTQHVAFGYDNNLNVIETALREQFGIDDQSHVLRAVAAHIWATIVYGISSDGRWGFCGQNDHEKVWTTREVKDAIASCRARLDKIESSLPS